MNKNVNGWANERRQLDYSSYSTISLQCLHAIIAFYTVISFLVFSYFIIITIIIIINITILNRTILLHFILQHCKSQKKNNFECYYEPFSRCTIEDALKTVNGSILTMDKLSYIRSSIPSKEDRHVEIPFNDALKQITAQTAG